MARSGEIVAERLRRERPGEDRTGIADQRHQPVGFGGGEGEMLGRIFIGDPDRLVEIRGDDQPRMAERLGRYRGARQRGEASLDIGTNRLGHCLGRRDQQDLCGRIMLGLAEPLGPAGMSMARPPGSEAT